MTMSITTTSLGWTLLCASTIFILFFIAYQFLSNRYLHPLSRVPGPFLASFSKLWFLYHAIAGQQHKVHVACHEKYGSVFRAMPNFVMVSDPKYVQQIYKFDRSEYFLAFEVEGMASIAGLRGMKEHNVRKKKLAAAYSISSLLQSEHHMNERINELITALQTHINHSKTTVINLGNWIHWLAVDVVMDLSFGAPLGFVAQGKDIGNLIQSVQALFIGANVMVNLPGLVKFMQLPFIWKLVGPKPTDLKGPGALQGVAFNAVKKRLEEGNVKGRRDLLQQFLEYRDQEGNTISKRELEIEALTPVEAGSDSTSAVMSAVFLHIITNPRVYNTLITELQTTPDLSTPISYLQAQSLPYLQAIIKESIRIYPNVGVPLPRVVPAGGIDIEGFFIPEGTWIGMAPWALGRRKETFGEDVEIFRPERWLENEDRRREWERSDVTFGSGAWVCLGKNLAMMEICKVVVELLRNFEVSIANPEKPWDAKNAMGIMQKNFMVSLTPREKKLY